MTFSCLFLYCPQQTHNFPAFFVLQALQVNLRQLWNDFPLLLRVLKNCVLLIKLHKLIVERLEKYKKSTKTHLLFPLSKITTGKFGDLSLSLSL